MSKRYISMVEKVDQDYHRSKIILHKSNGYYLAEFAAVDQLDAFSQMMGFTYTLREERVSPMFGLYQEFDISHEFKESCLGGFYKTDNLPDGAKPFLGLSNGGIVTCYFVNDGETISIFRPNPNAKSVYNPLPLHEHIMHQQRFGVY